MARPAVPMIGLIFTELTVLEFSHIDNEARHYKCLCSCGNTFTVLGASLRNGRVKRCIDCTRVFRFDKASDKYKAAVLRHGRTKYIWKAMIQRCTNPNYKQHKDYLGRGIMIDDPRWFKYENFKADMGEAPLGLQIDRIDNDKGYSKANCEWVTPKQNASHRRPASHQKNPKEETQTNEEDKSWTNDQSAMLLN